MQGLSGYRSAVAYVRIKSSPIPTLVAVGPSGTDYSTDDGKTWQAINGPAFDTLSFARTEDQGRPVGWAAGAEGIIAKWTLRSISPR